MSITTQIIPTSLLRAGVARVEITPPPNIYHPMWGAARHQRATGIHRPLYGDALALAPLGGAAAPLIRLELDHVGMDEEQQTELIRRASQSAGVPPGNVQTTFSHSHSSGNFARDRVQFPGGELIPAYLEELYTKMADAARRAVADLQEAVITYATGHCALATNRDYWDVENGIFACGYNATAPQADDTLLLARITDSAGNLRATLVNYACHPTTLAWENTLISPDYIGAMREVVEAATGAPCIFALGACGELGPRQSHQGATAVADANGRQLGYAALAALAGMSPPAQDFAYRGPVISGATLADWRHAPMSAAHQQAATRFSGGNYVVELPQKPLPDAVALEAEMEEWGTLQQEADARGDAIAARNYGARLERARRWRMRIRYLPNRPTLTYHFSVHRLGDAIWITVGGEPYSLLQTTLRQRFPDYAILLTPLAGDFQAAYLLPAELYGVGLYQEEPSIPAKGSLEILIEAVAQRIGELI